VHSGKPLILVTNDDGVHSPGLLAAAEAVSDLGELLIAAPALGQSAMGRAAPDIRAKSIQRHTLTINGKDVPAYAIPGTPAQAVIYSMLVLAGRRPDLVISGINYGENLGTLVTVSGTVGAALEAGVAGVPALAVSLETDKVYHRSLGQGLDWRAAAHATRQMARYVLQNSLPFDVDVLKIEIPANATAETPWRMTRQSRQPWFVTFALAEAAASEDEMIDLDYRNSVSWESLEPDSDIHAFALDRVIALTPLSVDLTSRTDLTALQESLRRHNGDVTFVGKAHNGNLRPRQD